MADGAGLNDAVIADAGVVEAALGLDVGPGDARTSDLGVNDVDLTDRADPSADAGNADSGPDDAAPAVQTIEVVPAYPLNGAPWNSYVVANRQTFSPLGHLDQACSDNLSDARDCVHAGELRMAALPLASCTGVSARDSLGAFDWVCRDDRGFVAVVSKRLKNSSGLKDLVTASGWRPIVLEVRLDGVLRWASLAAPPWWSNPIQDLAPELGLGGIVSLDARGTIYVVASGGVVEGVKLAAPHVGLVVLAGQSLAVRPGLGPLCKGGTSSCLVEVNAVDFTWVEGELDGAGVIDDVVLLTNTRHSRVQSATLRAADSAAVRVLYGNANAVRVVHVSQAPQGVFLAATRGNLVEYVEAVANAALYLQGAGSNTLRHISSVNPAAAGIYVHPDADGNDFADIECSGSPSNCLMLRSDSNHLVRLGLANNRTGVRVQGGHNVIHDVVAANNITGIAIGASDNTLTRVVALANQEDGVSVGGHRNTLLQLTLVNNFNRGLFMNGASSNTVVHLLSANCDDGIRLHSLGTDLNRFHQIAIANVPAGGTGIYLNGSSNTFAHNLLVTAAAGSRRCVVAGGSAPGLIDGSCTATGSDGDSSYPGQRSTARLQSSGVDFTMSIVGKVTVDDPQNGSDHNGARDHDQITYWTGAANRYRGWGLDGSAFAALDHSGRCTSGLCRIWDLRLRADDRIVRGTSRDGSGQGAPFLVGQTCPEAGQGDQWAEDLAQPPRFFLVNAIELMGDTGVGAGDDDGLCESDEVCILAPNFGAYQGEESPTSAGFCVYEDRGGPVTGVQMLGYPINGAP